MKSIKKGLAILTLAAGMFAIPATTGADADVQSETAVEQTSFIVGGSVIAITGEGGTYF